MVERTIILFIFCLAEFLFISDAAPEVSDYALKAFSEQMLSRDDNNVGNVTILNLQHRYQPRSAKTVATEPLLYIDETYIRSRPTFVELIRYFNTESLDAKQNFLRAVVRTSIMKETIIFLGRTGVFRGGIEEFIQLLDRLWFTTYKRGNQYSSGFKHVFMAEAKIQNGISSVNGMHNWVFFAQEEQKREIEYLGWKAREYFVKDDKRGSIIVIKFNWKKMVKETGSMFVGTSPEFEMALYTTCFLLRPNSDCTLQIGGMPISIETHTQRSSRGEVIGTAFPKL